MLMGVGSHCMLSILQVSSSHSALCPAEYPNTVNTTPNHIGILYAIDAYKRHRCA